MDNTTYPGSGTDITDCDFHSMASNELNFVDHWVDSTVEKEVLRGSKLRQEKLKSYPQQNEYEVANVDLVRPLCVDIRSYYSFRKSSPRRTKLKTGSCTPKSNSLGMRRSSTSRAYTSQLTYSRPNTSSFKAKYGPKCPMRIAELAVPTKRQCIDTWRNKHDVLPEFMVERLRQQVMDEKPIVQIKEAISCFKRGKLRSPKSMNRSKNATRGRDLNERMNEIRIFALKFANKIAHRLIKPQNLILTNKLEKISKIVAGDITNVINRKKYDLDVITSNRIQAEIADKITVWITTILEDTSYKILEEDLRELEEEEGPVLDFIDDLVDNVMIQCEPQEIAIQENDYISETTSKAYDEEIDGNNVLPDPVENNEFDNSTQYTNNTYGTGDATLNKSNEIDHTVSTGLIQGIDNKSFDQSGVVESTEMNINDHIRGEIVKIVDSVIPADQDVKIEENNLASDKDIDYKIEDAFGNETDITEKHQDLQKSPGNSELTAQLKEVQSDLDLALTEDVVLSPKNSIEDDKDDPDSNTQNLKADNDNVSDVFELLDEESLDDKDKKVKFSEVEMDVGGTAIQLDINSAVESTEPDSHEKERVSWHSSTDIHELVFAPPNEHLLSDADESWPNDITTPVLKPSASVCRSITSLGKILEKDEKGVLLQDEMQWEAHQIELEILNQTEEKLENIKKANEQEAQRATEIKDESKIDFTNRNNLKDVTDETASFLKTIKIYNEKTIIDKSVEAIVPLEPENNGLILNSSTSLLKITIIDDVSVNNQATIKEKQLTEKNIKNLESDTNVIYEAVQQKMKSSYYAIAEPKHDYKVHARTAPSWLQQDHGKGEPSEDSFRGGKSREKIKETEIRNWCNDLDRMFVNLEMWNGWITTTCDNIIGLKKNKKTNKKTRKEDWIILKKNIDKDAVLWTKLNQRAYERLKIYKDKTKIVSTEYCMLCDCKNNVKTKV